MRISSLVVFATLPVVSRAFAPVVSRKHQRMGLAVVTGANGVPAASKEEDLALTIEIIKGAMAPLEEEDGGPTASAAASSASAEANPDGGKKKAKKAKKQAMPAAEVVMDVSKLDIRVGRIVEAWEHEEADRLFCETIDIGEDEPRRIATGVRAYYKAEDLVGRRVCVLANLKSRKLMGYPSHGMVLCASTDDGSKVVFLEPPADAEIGERCSCDGFEGEPATENQVGKKKILDKVFPDFRTDGDGVATYKGVPLTAGSGRCQAEGGLANAAVA